MSKKKRKREHKNLEMERWKGFSKVFHSPPPESDLTPREAIWKKNKATLWYYPAKNKKYAIPLFLVYSMVNQPFILDLAPGSSTIESYVNEGYDVYLIDFGIPGFEDKDLTLNYYVTEYIQRGVKRALKHSKAKGVTVIGYCLGGTLAAMYAAIAEEPVKNLVLTVTPIDFSAFPIFDKWFEAANDGQLDVDSLIDTIGIVPGPMIKAGVRMITSPVYISPYLSLLNKAYDKEYVEHWHRFNHWTNGHIPFPGAALKQLIHDLGKSNKLINGGIEINGKKASLHNIHANLLAIASTYDRLVPEQLISPVMEHVSSKDRTYISLEDGHTGLASGGRIPEFLKNWLHERSGPI